MSRNLATILTRDRQQRAFHMLMLLLVASSRSKLLRRRANSPRRTITAVGEPRWWR